MKNRHHHQSSPLFASPAKPKLPAVIDVAGGISDCWNQIGVMGDGSCEALAQFVHCRNCSVYSAAGARLLDRELPADYRRDWSVLFSREKKLSPKNKTSVVIFRLGEEWLALPTFTFQEITERRAIHSLPHRQHQALLGVINIRGELQLCVCLGKLLGIARQEDNGTPAPINRLVVAEWQGTIFSFPVDEIHGIHRYLADELRAVPSALFRGRASFIRGVLAWRDQSVGCLDEDLVFSTLNRSLT